MKQYYHVYIARCCDNTLYTGITADLIAREQRHNKGYGSKYTRTRRPIKIIYSEKFETKKEAARREYQLKGWSKIKKERLIQSRHPNIKNIPVQQ